MKKSILLLGMILGASVSATAQVQQNTATNATAVQNDSLQATTTAIVANEQNANLTTQASAEALKAKANYEEEILKAEKARQKAEEKLAKEQAKAAKNAKKKAEREAKEAKIGRASCRER